MLFLIVLDVFALSTAQEIQQNTIYPVVNKNNPQNSISKNGLSAIFKMRLRKWNDNSPVTVFVLKDDDALHKQFSKKVLNVFPHHMRRIWNRAVFSGSGQAPVLLKSKKDMILKLESIPGAVGYLKGEDLTDDIKILDIR